ncbi:unnamed protein product [Rotaria socialis]|uniref:Uncharacterized protein n=1 Tax=Rotaria socialis TaxID=392032 RepID=A0A821QHU4_9BILA|nr:unnamed protein product [Rotaria socialis]
MAAPLTDWKALLKVNPNEIDADNEADDDRNDNLGVSFINLNPGEIDNSDDLRVALRLGQRLAKFYRAQKEGCWDKLISLAQENDKLKDKSLAGAASGDTVVSNALNQLREEVEYYRRSYEDKLGEAGQVRDELKRCEARVRELQNEKENLKKVNEDLQKRMGELRDPSRMKPDDGERTSRVRVLEKELDGALTENQQLYDENQKLNAKFIVLQKDKVEADRQINELSNEYARNKVCRKQLIFR